jgi:hypothetical protein
MTKGNALMIVVGVAFAAGECRGGIRPPDRQDRNPWEGERKAPPSPIPPSVGEDHLQATVSSTGILLTL